LQTLPFLECSYYLTSTEASKRLEATIRSDYECSSLLKHCVRSR